MGHDAFGVPDLPHGFWVRSDVRAALQRSDMGGLFRLLNDREVGNLSQIRIGTAIGMSQGRVSLISRDLQKVPSKAVLSRIADGLAMPDHARGWLGLASSQQNEKPQRQASKPGHGDQATELLRQIHSARYLDGQVIDLLRQETDAIRLLDRRLGAPAVAAKLRAHVSQLQEGLRYSLSPSRRQLSCPAFSGQGITV